MAYVAPAGTPLTFGDLAKGSILSMSSSATGRLKRQLCRVSMRERTWLLSTGRAAMLLAFEAMKRIAGDPHRVEVIVPGYTCYSVPAAVERAGLVPRLCDVDPATLSPDLDSLAGVEFGRVLAIVSSNLYGFPNALHEIESLSRRHGVFMLDDAAQALGARLQGQPVGSFGDVGLYSFDKGKNITTLQGGVLTANSGPLEEAIESVTVRLRDAPSGGTLFTLLKLCAYALLLRPGLYGMVRRLPLGLGLTPYDTDYPVTLLSRALTGLASLQLERLDAINGARIGNADRLRSALSDVGGLSLTQVTPGGEPVYTRLPVLAHPTRRMALISALETAGIGATASYPSALIDVPQVALRLPVNQRLTPGAREVADRIVTLPTHGYSPSDLPGRIRAISERVMIGI